MESRLLLFWKVPYHEQLRCVKFINFPAQSKAGLLAGKETQRREKLVGKLKFPRTVSQSHKQNHLGRSGDEVSIDLRSFFSCNYISWEPGKCNVIPGKSKSWKSKLKNIQCFRLVSNFQFKIVSLESGEWREESGWSIISLLLGAGEEVINLPNGELAKIYARNASPRKFQLNRYMCTNNILYKYVQIKGALSLPTISYSCCQSPRKSVWYLHALRAETKNKKCRVKDLSSLVCVFVHRKLGFIYTGMCLYINQRC